MPNMLNKKDSLLLVIDAQEKLVNMIEKDIAISKIATLCKAAKILEISTIATEQYPKGLGSTVEKVKQSFAQNTPIFEKTAFSALKELGFADILKSYNKKQIIICGIETHVCVHQTVADLLYEGYEVYVAKDACASRNKLEFEQGIELMQSNGAKISCVEIILFEWLESAKNPYFKEAQDLIK